MNGAYSITDTTHLFYREKRVGGYGDFIEGFSWERLEKFLLQILIEVAITQVNTLGADEE